MYGLIPKFVIFCSSFNLKVPLELNDCGRLLCTSEKWFREDSCNVKAAIYLNCLDK